MCFFYVLYPPLCKMTPCYQRRKANAKRRTFKASDWEARENLSVLETEFKTKPFQKVNVKDIVEKSGIARGSFYQYFENLEDAYFTILEKETVDIHAFFMRIFAQKNKQLIPALEEYGTQVAEILFNEQTYMIYKNRYLYWSEDLNRSWK